MCLLEEVWRVSNPYCIVNVKEGEKERKEEKNSLATYFDKIRKGLK